MLNEAVLNPVPPVDVPEEEAVCREVVHLATEEGFDVRRLVPAPTNTPEDAGPYITLGMCYASDPETHVSDITIPVSYTHLDVYKRQASWRATWWYQRRFG